MKSYIQIIKELKTHLTDEFGNDIKDVILFGSRAKGTAKEYSDYDVMLIINNTYDWMYKSKIIDNIYEYELENDVYIDIHIISDFELKHTIRGIQPIFIDAINEGIYA